MVSLGHNELKKKYLILYTWPCENIFCILSIWTHLSTFKDDIHYLEANIAMKVEEIEIEHAHDVVRTFVKRVDMKDLSGQVNIKALQGAHVHIAFWWGSLLMNSSSGSLMNHAINEDSRCLPSQKTKNCHNVNSLWPTDAIWCQISRSTLAPVMTCCLTAPSHYLNQCWLIFKGALWHSPESNFIGIFSR